MASIYRHTWDADSNKDLLIAMYETLSPSGEQIRSIVEKTTTMGYTFTPKAVTYFYLFYFFFPCFTLPLLLSFAFNYFSFHLTLTAGR